LTIYFTLEPKSKIRKEVLMENTLKVKQEEVIA
jgi:hypothetical protein